MTVESNTETMERTMEIMPMGDYYEWHCDWCDSRNLTLWTRFDSGAVACGACHQSLAIPSLPEQGSGKPYYLSMSRM